MDRRDRPARPVGLWLSAAALLVVFIAAVGSSGPTFGERIRTTIRHERAVRQRAISAKLESALGTELSKGAPPAAGAKPIKSVACDHAAGSTWRCVVDQDLLALPDARGFYSVTVAGTCWHARQRQRNGAALLPSDAAFDALMRRRARGCWV